MTNYLLEAKKITKRFAKQTVLKDLSLSIAPKTVTLITGKNGSGKSTLLQILSGLKKPTSGDIIDTGSSKSYHGHSNMLYEHMTAKENIDFFLSLYNQKVFKVDKERWGLTDFDNGFVRNLSAGQKARLSLFRALKSNSELLFLDEPSSALDASSLELLLSEITEAKKSKRSIVLSTHNSELFTPITDIQVEL